MTEGLFKPLFDYGITSSGTILGIDSTTIVVDPYTNVSGTFIPMQVLVNRRDLYNDEDNPLHVHDLIPILGNNGLIANLEGTISNVNEALGPLGWYTQYIKNWTYPSPQNLLIYYGWLSSFNYGANAWNLEKVAQDFAKYNYIVFGNGIASPSHGDYSNTLTIIDRIKGLNQHVKIFGYVTIVQSLNDFKAKVDEWNTIGVNGIFMDESGYDYGKTRSEFNDCVDYVHSRSSANVCFVNAWNLDHVLGTDNDPNYPNSVYNTASGVSNLVYSDWCLLESYTVNTTSFSSNGGYESKTEWQQRGLKAINKRFEFGINLAAAGIIDNSTVNGQDLFNFSFVSAMMWNLDAFGTSDTLYGASSATIKYWPRPRTEGLGREWAISPSVQNDYNDLDKYHRFLDFGKLSLDFSAGAQTVDIERFSQTDSTVIKFNVGDLTEGQSYAPTKTTASGSPITGLAYDDTIEEYMFDSFQIPTYWKHGTDVKVKVHFFNDYSQEGDTTCRWALDYQIYSELDSISNKTTTTITMDKDLPTDVASDTFMTSEFYMSSNDSNNPIKRDSIVSFKIYRDCTHANDTMVNDAILILLTFEFLTEVL